MNESLTSPNIPASRKLKQEDFQRYDTSCLVRFRTELHLGSIYRFLNNSLNYDKESPEKGEAKRSRKDLILNRRSDPTDQAKTEVSERQLFDDRLKTFQPLLWTASNPVTPLECARYGWKLVAADLLKCVTCEVMRCISVMGQITIHSSYSFSGSGLWKATLTFQSCCVRRRCRETKSQIGV